jgi:signal transduction histidine kinase
MAESIRKKMGSNGTLVKRMDQVISALHHAIRDLRQFITALEPDAPQEALLTGLRKLAQEPHLQSLVRVDIKVNCPEESFFPPARASHVLAIVNEAFSNIIRHAQARHVWVVAERQNGQLDVTIADDGIGLTDSCVPGFGLRNMRDRARLLGGTLRIEPRAPQGTQILLSIPWEDAK